MAFERILIVEDNRELLRLCRDVLKANGYDVTLASRGEEALALLTDGKFDLLLTDIQLPGLSGLEVAGKLRSRGFDLPVVAMTAYGTMETAIQALTLGVDEFIVKPFTAEHLGNIVSRGLEKTRLKRENARLKTLLPLFEITRDLVSSASNEEVQSQIVNAARRLSESSQVGLLELDQGSKNFKLVAGSGGDVERHVGEVSPFRLPATIKDGDSRVVSWKGEENAPMPFGLRAEKGNGVMCAPLLAGDRSLGFIVALRSEYFSESDLDAMAILAGQASVALENSRLIADLNRTYEELRNLDRLKSEFINIAAHELRTPLSVLIGYALLLREELKGEQRERADYVVVNAERLRRVAEELLSLRYLETGQAELRLETIQVADAVKSVVGAYDALALEKHQAITLALDPEPIQVQADRGMLDLMLGNLVSNAIKFSSPGAPIRVESCRDADSVTIVVRDRGPGIPKSETEKIFERFYQVGSSLTRQHEGLGLGLAITREMAIAHGGRIWLESRAGAGSAFYLSLPLIAQPLPPSRRMPP